MGLRFWPQSLFGRLIAVSVIAVLVAQAIGLVLIAQEREKFVLQGSVREWSRRITETTLLLQPLSAEERAETVSALVRQAPAYPPLGRRLRGQPPPAERGFVHLPLLGDFERPLREQLRASLGAGYTIEVTPTPEPAPAAIPLPVPFLEAREVLSLGELQHYDVAVHFPDGGAALFRVTRPPQGAPLPRNLIGNLVLLVLLLVLALYLAARNVTRPLSELARAADSVGRDARPQQLEERGARELRDAARAFNTMQDRLRRYLDSRSRVLAAMSHDLKTPLTRLRLQVETLLEPELQARMGGELDEMESMVHEALALFRGLDDGEAAVPCDVNALLATLRQEFLDMAAVVTVSGAAREPYVGKPQALKRLLTNLVANAIKFGGRADVSVSDGAQLVIAVRDRGPGIPHSELERVFEPFYRLESSRNRDSGGTGLGLSIARDVAQAHGGTLTLHNVPAGGLEARLTLPRRR
jgi:signal transduction histidine kinase